MILHYIIRESDDIIIRWGKRGVVNMSAVSLAKPELLLRMSW